MIKLETKIPNLLEPGEFLKEISNPGAEKPEYIDWTIRKALLLTLLSKDSQESPDKSKVVKNYSLAQKIATVDEVELSIDETSEVTKLAAKILPTAISGFLCLFLEESLKAPK